MFTLSSARNRIVVSILFVAAVTLLLASSGLADGGDYSLDFKAADPTGYPRLTPASLALSCPASGRGADPLAGAQHSTGVTSLAPQNMGLGQVVAFELLVSVDPLASVANDGTIHLTAGWSTETTSGTPFGFDESYGVLCAFVDSADASAQGGDQDASVTILSQGVVGGEIQGTFEVSGLDAGEKVVVEFWLVLDGSIPPGTKDGIHSTVISAETYPYAEAIPLGSQTIPLKAGDFFRSAADVSVTKDDDGLGTKWGQLVTYAMVVRNSSGTSVANEVRIVDTLDLDTVFQSLDIIDTQGSPSDFVQAGGVITADLGFLNPGEVVSLTLTVLVSDTAPKSGTVESGTCVGADLCNRVEAQVLADNDLNNNTAVEPTNVIRAAVGVDKTASALILPVGGGVEFNYDVYNPGEEALSFNDISDDLCSPVLYESGDANANDLLDLGETWTYSCGMIPAESITNTVTVTATGSLNEQVMATDSLFVEVISTGIGINKTPSAAVVYPGDAVTYTYSVVNAGEYDLSGVTVTDDKCAPVTFQDGDDGDELLAPASETWRYTCVATLDQDTTNHATVVATDTLGLRVSDWDSAFVNVIDPALQVTLVADPAMISFGDAVLWEVTVTNSGDDPLADVILSDANGHDYGAPFALGVGESRTFSYSVQPADSVTNTVSATGSDSLGNPVSDADSADLTVIHPAIEVVKSASAASVEAGDPVTWTISVYNRGDTPLYGVIVSDGNGMSFGPVTLATGDGNDAGGSDQLTWSYADVYAEGNVQNVATAEGHDVLGTVVSDQDQASVVVTPPQDTDGDGIPDRVEGDQDTDGDGIPDYQDPDSDGDGIPDSVEAGDDPTNPVDTDGDGIPDYQDTDSDGDGIPDSVEAGDDPANPVDSDGDGTPDYQDLDSDGDGIPDSVEAGEDPTHPVDTDGDGTPDYLDLDSDGDGIPDSVEAGEDPLHPVDTDADGTPDYLDDDSDGDGLRDTEEWSEGAGDPLAGCTADDPRCFDNDADGDGIPNYLDPDSDGDGRPDVEEGTGDADGDGIPDWLDPDAPPADPEKYIILLPFITVIR